MFFYSLITEFLFRLFSILTPVLGVFFPKLSKYVHDRKKASALDQIKPADYVFFCSSAGEFDQIIPILDQLKEQKKTTFIIFFSTSGIHYLQKTRPDQPHILMPYDSHFFWKRLYSSLKPKKIFVVRYEFWPAFLKVSSTRSLYLLFWHKQDLQRSFIKKNFYQWCLSHFKSIFCVDRQSQDFLIKQFHIDPSKTFISGDTKYERALSRETQSNSTLAINHEYIVIGGSVWPEDLEVLLPAFKDFALEVKAKLILVPHDISKPMIHQMGVACEEHQLSFSTQSSLPKTLDHDVVIIHSMGQLAQIYPVANFAFIGGAMHHRVHNVLEAAAANLAISFGPHHHTSHEAKLMVKENLACVSGTSDQLHQILAKAHKNYANGIPTGSLDFMQKHIGASKFIIEKTGAYKPQ